MTLTPEMVEIIHYTPEQFVLMAASVDYHAGKKMKALHEMLTQAAVTERKMQDIRAQSQRAVGWMPIDTAPKDEAAHYLVRIPGNDVCGALVLQVSNFEGGTYADCRDGLIDWTDRITTATHWMPIALIDRAGGGHGG